MIVFKLLLIAMVYVGAAIGLAWFLARQFQTPKAKMTTVVLMLLVFALIPTWDILPGRLYFNHLCETEGGLKIYKTVEGVEGFRYAVGAAPGREVLEKYGYKFVEVTMGGDSVYRYTLDANGKIVRQDVTKPASRYSVRSERHNPHWNTRRHEKLIEDSHTKEILAVRIQFEYLGNWLQQKFNPLLGGGAYCELPMGNESDFYIKTLKPAK